MNLAKFYNFLVFIFLGVTINLFPQMSTKQTIKNDVHTIIRTRRSVRRFKQIPVPLEILKQIVYDATLAPSAGNKQPWEFIIVTDDKIRSIVFDNIFWLASAGKPPKEQQPQAYIIVLGNPQISKEYIYDCSAAIQNILLSAWGYGIGSCWIGSINREKIYESFKIPKYLKIVAIIALGYPDEQPQIEYVDKSTDVAPYKKNNTLIVPKRKVDDVIHLQKY